MVHSFSSARSQRERCPTHRVVLFAFFMAILVLPTGCVRRRLNVRTNPPGALVYVDNQLIGETPCGVDFTYYGTREIRLVKPGFEPLAINQPIPTPWYQYPGLDFVSENLWPAKIRDNRTVVYDLRPQVLIPEHQLIEQGEQLRRESQGYPIQPAGAVVPMTPGPMGSPAPAVAPSFGGP
jgi:hypothetical protein